MSQTHQSKTWIDRVRQTESYHKHCLRSDSKWSVRDSALALDRSIGSISQDLLLAAFLKENEEELSKFRYYHDALEFVRSKRKQERLT